MAIRLIVTDLDDTLLRRDKTISSYTAQVFARCRAKGILVAFATARGGRSIKHYIECIAPDVLVTSGGALARRGDEVLYQCFLPRQRTDELIKLCMAEPSVGYISADTQQGLLVDRAYDHSDPFWSAWTHAKPTDFTQGLGCEAQKLAVEFDDETAAARVATQFQDVATLKWTGSNWHQFAHKNATKWHAIEAVAEQLVIATDEIVAFGDDANDLDMLRFAGTGVAMENAIESAKTAANEICGSCDDDGVAHWLEKNIL